VPDVARGFRSVAVEEVSSRDAYRLLVSVLIPRPIAWVSTVSKEGKLNLAPYSFFNGVASDPLTVMFSAGRRKEGGPKDSLRNAQETGAFVVNLADEGLAEAMNHTSGAWAHGVSEFEEAGLTPHPSLAVTPPRVAEAPVALECRTSQIIPVAGSSSTLVLGRVLHLHVREDLLGEDGLVVAERFRPIARLGRDEYTTLGRVFSLARPRVETRG